MEVMLQERIYFSASCGGRGTCGKCRIRVVDGSLEINSFDRAAFGKQELEQGYRLSCQAFPKGDCTIRITASDEADFMIVADYDQGLSGVRMTNPSTVQDQVVIAQTSDETGYSIGIDIGTTTLAASLVSLSDGTVRHTSTAINKQRAYGADVITRIKASMEGKSEVLKKCIRDGLFELILGVLRETGTDASQIKKLAIAGNTTMGHLLMGYPLETLGSYPFTPVNIQMIELSFLDLFQTTELNAPVTILPGISAFVGGDIAAGLLACGFDQADKPCLLIDLGTNGELAIGNKQRIMVTSTAAGPAFEGGNISCGVGSIAGAISKVRITENNNIVETIGHKPPVGICGTGVIELASELLRSGLMDETGLLTEEYFEGGYPVAADEEGTEIIVTQKDIRELQLAKAAIRAGIETLLHRYGTSYEEIGSVYLAGGFGYQLDLAKAVHIGLLPEELSGKVIAAGNTSLGGVIRYMTDASAKERLQQIIKASSEIHLSNDEEFNRTYIENMNFPIQSIV